MTDEMTDAELDRLLAAVPPASAVPAALERRILAEFDRIQARPSLARMLRRAADAVWPGAPVWQPAGALALALLLGVGVAVLAPLDLFRADTPVFALEGAPDTDAGQGI